MIRCKVLAFIIAFVVLLADTANACGSLPEPGFTLGEIPTTKIERMTFEELLSSGPRMDGRFVAVQCLLAVPPKGLSGVPVLFSGEGAPGWAASESRIWAALPDGWAESLNENMTDGISILIPVTVIGELSVHPISRGRSFTRTIGVEYLVVCDEKKIDGALIIDCPEIDLPRQADSQRGINTRRRGRSGR